MTAKLGGLSDREKSVVETIRMRLNIRQSLVYLKEVGFDISERTLRRDRRKIENLKLQRLYHIAKIGFEDQHLETIDEFHMGFCMMWKNVLREQDPYKQNSMIKDILLLKPYLSAYYEATKLIIDKQQSEYKEFLDKQLQQHEQEQQEDKEEEEELNRDINDKSDIKEEYNPNRKF